MTSFLLDSSAILALLQRERGWERIVEVLPASSISAVNYAEVWKKLIDGGIPKPDVQSVLSALHLNVIPFGPAEAAWSVDFIHPGVSLADRACLGTARHTGLPVLTGDRLWLEIRQTVEVELFR